MLGILCPGQGSQHPEMLRLLDGEPRAQAVLAVAGANLGRDLQELAGNSVDSHRNRWAQPLLCAAAAATWAALGPQLPAPRVFAGYSVGELAAYACAGALTPRELIGLVRERARLMDEAMPTPSTLVAVGGLLGEQIAQLCKQCDARIAIVNGRDRFVLGVTRSNSAALQQRARGLGALVTPLAVELAAHTDWLAAASAGFRTHLRDSGLAAPLTPVLAGINGLPVTTRADAIEVLAQQISTTIDWAACQESLREQGCRVLLELGPGNRLARMAREAMPNLAVRSAADFRSLQGVVDWVLKVL